MGIHEDRKGEAEYLAEVIEVIKARLVPGIYAILNVVIRDGRLDSWEISDSIKTRTKRAANSPA